MPRRKKHSSEIEMKPTRGTAKKSKKAQKKRPLKVIIILAIICVIAFGVYRFIQPNLSNIFTPNEEGKVITITEASLEKVLKESQLYTAEYPYNSYVEVKDGSSEDIKYYVAYDGTIKAGFNVNDVTVKMSDDQTTITIQLPQISVMDVTVDASSLEYIFADDKYNTETVASEAYNKANEDLQKKADSDKEIIDAATSNAKMVEKELVEPWVNQVDKDHQYTVIVLSAEESSSVTNTQASEQSSEEQTNE